MDHIVGFGLNVIQLMYLSCVTQLPALATDQKVETTLQPILVHEFKRRVSTS
jgi:hypothetical protein